MTLDCVRLTIKANQDRSVDKSTLAIHQLEVLSDCGFSYTEGAGEMWRPLRSDGMFFRKWVQDFTPSQDLKGSSD